MNWHALSFNDSNYGAKIINFFMLIAFYGIMFMLIRNHLLYENNV